MSTYHHQIASRHTDHADVSKLSQYVTGGYHAESVQRVVAGVGCDAWIDFVRSLKYEARSSVASAISNAR